MPHEKLLRVIQRESQRALNSRQVARRLESLLPQRLREISRAKRGQVGKAAAADRMALCDESYLNFVEEFVSIHGEAVAGRVQYETHMMLFEARRTLRNARSAPRHGRK
ncbi:MAG: hypothetical protein RIQ81_1189 [Pseudomonadota bacterium]|jgi:hypothetical protein